MQVQVLQDQMNIIKHQLRHGESGENISNSTKSFISDKTTLLLNNNINNYRIHSRPQSQVHFIELIDDGLEMKVDQFNEHNKQDSQGSFLSNQLALF